METEVGIYKRKKESKKKKQELDQESDQENKNSTKKKRKSFFFLDYFLGRVLVFYYKFPPQGWEFKKENGNL